MLQNFAMLMARINNPSDKYPLHCEMWAVQGVWYLSVFRVLGKTGRDTECAFQGVHLDELAKEALAVLGPKR